MVSRGVAHVTTPTHQAELRRLAYALIAHLAAADDAHAETGKAQRVGFDMREIEQLVAAAGLVSVPARRAALRAAEAVDDARRQLAISRAVQGLEQVAQHHALREAVTAACTALRNLASAQFSAS